MYFFINVFKLTLMEVVWKLSVIKYSSDQKTSAFSCILDKTIFEGKLWGYQNKNI